MTAHSLDLFKAMVAKRGPLDLTEALSGFITDFQPSPEQLVVLRSKFKPLPVTTLFSVAERRDSDPFELIQKQILHYIEVYGLESPGLFNLEVSAGHIATLAYIRAVTVEELTAKVHDLIYANRPIADVKPVVELIREYGIPYKVNQVKNNELRVAVFDPAMDTFTSGDDAVRWICYKATDSPMLIKSEAVVDKVEDAIIEASFLARHVLPLAQVFNRHKRIILAAKDEGNKSIVNQISKLSKTRHVPLHEPVSKRFIAGAISGEIPILALEGISLRDHFKYLNLIE